MRCLMCGNEKEEVGFTDLFDGSDPLCSKCRREWKRIDWHSEMNGVPVYVPYLYNDAFSSCLIQFKECGDEALKDVFIHDVIRVFRRKYRGYTILLMPSSQKRSEERGFLHLKEMFSCTGMQMMDPFVKKHDISQKQKSPAQRRQMRNEIQLKEGIVIPHKIVLVDDIITTGSTIAGALDCLDRNKRKIKIFALGASSNLILLEHSRHSISGLIMRSDS